MMFNRLVIKRCSNLPDYTEDSFQPLEGRNMRHSALLAIFLIGSVQHVSAHDSIHKLMLPRVELFDWVERCELPSYRERYNRPRYIGGKIAYHIAPSSQEAMSWHENHHRGSYRNHAGPTVRNFRFPKPWEVLPVGPRTPSHREVNHHADVEEDLDLDLDFDVDGRAEEIKPGKIQLAPSMKSIP